MLIQSEHVKKALGTSHRQFKRLFGVKRQTFYNMLEILQEAYEQLHKNGGKPPTKLFVEDRLLIMLQYWREYRTMEHLAYEYNTVKSYIHKVIEWSENVLARDGTYRLQGKKILTDKEDAPKTVAIDVTEHRVERPKKIRSRTIPASKSAIL
jgi:hypothetical protein